MQDKNPASAGLRFSAKLLTLKIISVNGKSIDQQLERVFDSFPVIVGRSANCDFILDDPSRFISSRHAIISLQDDLLSVEDCSSNGSYINGSNVSIGHGNRANLTNGDKLTIGDYTVSVKLTDVDNNETHLGLTGAKHSGTERFVEPDFSHELSTTAKQRSVEPDFSLEPSTTAKQGKNLIEEIWHNQIQSAPPDFELDATWDNWINENSNGTLDLTGDTPEISINRDNDLDWLPRTSFEPESKTSTSSPVTNKYPISKTDSRSSDAELSDENAVSLLLSAAGLESKDFPSSEHHKILEAVGSMLRHSIN